jgi:hypothetical protein
LVQVLTFFRNLFPDTSLKVTIMLDLEDLEDLLAKRDAMQGKLGEPHVHTHAHTHAQGCRCAPA